MAEVTQPGDAKRQKGGRLVGLLEGHLAGGWHKQRLQGVTSWDMLEPLPHLSLSLPRDL